MNKLKEILWEGKYSCVISNDDEIQTFSQPGIRDIYALLKESPNFLNGALVADKVIGKAVAALMILGGVKEVYTDVISLSALAFLRKADIVVNFSQAVPYISKRDNTGVCPLEQMCMSKQNPHEILNIIEEFMQRILAKVG